MSSLIAFVTISLKARYEELVVGIKKVFQMGSKCISRT
jgi:hypothetical protein